VTPWRLCSIELGAIARASPRAGSAIATARPPWDMTMQRLDGVSRALAAEDAGALHDELAPEVQIQPVGGSLRSFARQDAVDALIAWRRGWQNCEVVLAELLISAASFAATGFVVGLDERGIPSCVSVHLMWSALPERV
jgi:hypothetical protein